MKKNKRIISFTLSLLMILTCFTAVSSTLAADGVEKNFDLSSKSCPQWSCDLQKNRSIGELFSQCEFFGWAEDNLYNTYYKTVAFFRGIVDFIKGLLDLSTDRPYVKVATPDVEATKLPEYESVKSADFYVAPNGDDENDGSLERPFKTIKKARDAVRTLDRAGKDEIVVGIMAGDYRVSGVVFTAEDSGTEACPVRYCKYGEGEVVLNGGASLNPEDFKPVTDEAMLSRLNDNAKKNVLCLDLSDYGVTKEDYGKLYAIGEYNTAAKYDGDYVGEIYSEVFFNDKRMTLARYPDTNEDFLYTQEVVLVGDGKEQSGVLKDADWDNTRNPKSDIYRVNEDLAKRINSWKTPDDVWMFGWWQWDWADGASPIGEFNYNDRTISPKFVSMYGAKEGAPYYFYNVFEELTTPGEFYLDRENGVLYIYPTEDMKNAKIDMSLITNSIFTVDNANYISFEGLTLKGTRGDSLTIKGNGNRATHCLIKNVAGNAIVATGSENVFSYNEITRTGRGGIILDGGDRETLTAGNSKAENNLIHDWSEIYQTYQPAVYLKGVGNICAHNEMFNSPHEAITWHGNNHIVEYNIIHDVCLLTNDGAAIYAGRRWDCYGNVIRYNYVYDLGSTVKNGKKTIQYTPDGIYFDDNLAGQTAYGNILVNVPKYGFLCGSGRDLIVRNNIVINSRLGIMYDNRAREGLTGGWFGHPITENTMYPEFIASPWQSEIWQKAYPQYKKYNMDFSNPDDPGMPFNPSDSVISENIIVSMGEKNLGNISDDVYRFGSRVENNLVLTKPQMKNIFTDPKNGDYTLKDIDKLQKQVPGFEQIPISKMGIVAAE